MEIPDTFRQHMLEKQREAQFKDMLIHAKLNIVTQLVAQKWGGEDLLTNDGLLIRKACIRADYIMESCGLPSIRVEVENGGKD